MNEDRLRRKINRKKKKLADRATYTDQKSEASAKLEMLKEVESWLD